MMRAVMNEMRHVPTIVVLIAMVWFFVKSGVMGFFFAASSEEESREASS